MNLGFCSQQGWERERGCGQRKGLRCLTLTPIPAPARLRCTMLERLQPLLVPCPAAVPCPQVLRARSSTPRAGVRPGHPCPGSTLSDSCSHFWSSCFVAKFQQQNPHGPEETGQHSREHMASRYAARQLPHSGEAQAGHCRDARVPEHRQGCPCAPWLQPPASPGRHRCGGAILRDPSNRHPRSLGGGWARRQWKQRCLPG